MGVLNFIKRFLPQPGLDARILGSKRQLLEVFDGITDPIMIVDCGHRILRLNRAMRSLLDETKPYTEFIGRYCHEVFHDKEEACDHCPVTDLVMSGGAILKRQMVDFIRDDKMKKFDVSVFPLKDDTGKVYAAVKYLKDVTYLAQLEMEMYDAERSKVLGSIALGLAHELRNPLAVISSEAQYLKKENPDFDTGKVMEKIIRNVEVANGVIADLLNFAKHKEQKIEVVDLNVMLENALRLVRDKLANQKIRVLKKTSAQEVWLDKSSFTHALVNFLLTSIEAMPGGGELRVETIRDDGHIRIMVSDTGKGYPPEIIDRMLSPFYRSRTGPVDLRLPIAEDIIKSHGGSVELCNNKDSGATITIHIPCVLRDELSV